MKLSSTKQIIKTVLYLFIFTILIGIVNFFILNKFLSKESEQKFNYLAEQKVFSVNRFYESIEQNVELLASGILSSIDDVNQLRNPAFVKRLESSQLGILTTSLHHQKDAIAVYVRYNPDFSSSTSGLFLTKEEGGKIISLPPTDISLYDPEDIEHVGWWTIPVKSGNAVWTDPYRNLNINTYMSSYVIPLYKNQKLVGVVGMDVDYDHANSIITQMKIYKTGFAYIEGKNGFVIHHPTLEFGNEYVPPKNFVEISHHLSNDMLFSITAPKREVYQSRNRVMAWVITFDFIIFVFFGAVICFIIFQSNYVKVMKDSDKKKHSTNPFTLGLSLGTFVFAILFIQFAFVCAKTGLFKTPSVIKEKPVFDETIIVLVQDGWCPYSYGNGELDSQGFNVELANLIGERLHKNIHIHSEKNWENYLDFVANKRADLIFGVEKDFEIENFPYYKSDSICKDYYVIYGKERINGLYDLRDKRIGRTIVDSKIDISPFNSNNIFYENFQELFDALSSGQIDYAIGLRTVAEYYLRSHRIKEFSNVYELMPTYFCIGVSKTSHGLLENVNACIDSLKSEDVLEKLESVWLDGNDTEISFVMILREHSIFFIVTSLMVVILFTVMLWIGIKTYYEEKHRVREKTLIELSETDQLSGLLNRGAGEKKIENLLAMQKAGMFILLDTDKFKSINDTYGHAVGDKVICAISDCLRTSFRDRDVVMRLGGDEFAAYAVGVTTEAEASLVIDRFFNCLNNIYIPEMDSKKVYVSVGAVFYDGTQPETFDDLYKRADALTYRSKAIEGSFVSFQE